MRYFGITIFMCLTGAKIVLSVGLVEEFSWSRITYQWPEEGQLRSRFLGADAGTVTRESRYRPRRPISKGGGSAVDSSIMFEGDTNANSAHKNDSTPNMDENVNEDTVSDDENMRSANYQYVNNVPMGANVWKDKLFITVPRRRLGVPSTLNYVPLNNADRNNVPLIPYPSWNINLYPDTSGNLENFVSVYRVAIDVCDRMWFVDTGIVETLGNRTQVKPHQLVAINLQTDQVIQRFNFPDNVLTAATILASLTVDTPKGPCGDAFVYFPDLAGYGLIVFSLRDRQFWRVTHNYFFLEPMAGDFNIAGHTFQWNDGVFSVELSDIKSDGYRDMFFHAMAGTHVYKVSTRVLGNESLATRSFHGDDFTVVGDRGPQSQTSTADIHKPTGIMFLGLVNQNAVGCWNTNKNLKTIDIVHKDDKNMIYPSDVKVFGDKVYVLTNTMPGFLYGNLNYDVTNFRVWANDIRKAVQNSNCQSGR